MALQLTQAELLNILGQYDAQGSRSLSPEIMQYLQTLPQQQDVGMDGNPSTAYTFDEYQNAQGRAPIGPDGNPMWEPREGWGGGMQSLRNAVGVLGGAALFGNLAMPMMGGGAGAGAAGAGAAAGGAGEAAALAAAENGILGSTVGMGTGGAGAAAGASGAGAAAAGAGASGASGAGSVAGAVGAVGSGAGFVGEGAMSGVPQWDRALLNAPAAGGISSMLGQAGSGLLGQAGSGLSGMLSSPQALAALLGAGAGIAGNSDINNTSNSSGTSSNTGSSTSGMTGTSNSQMTGTSNNQMNGSAQGSASQSLAPWLQGYAQDYVGRAQQLAGGPTSNRYLDQAGSMLMGSADDPLVQAARSQQQTVLSGGLLGGNPYINNVARGVGDRMGEAYATGTRAGTFSNYNNDGNSVQAKSGFGQTLGNNDRAFGDALGQTMSGLYANNYNNERSAQDAAARNSLAFGNYGQQSANNLSQFGQQDWMRPYQQNQMYGQAINPAFGSQSQNAANTSQNNVGNMSQNTVGNTAQNGWQNSQNNGTTTGANTQNIQAPSNLLAGLGGAAAGAGLWQNIFGPRR